MRHPYANALLFAALSGCLSNTALAQNRKPVVTATAVPAKTAKLLTSKLARLADNKTKKTTSAAGTSVRQPVKLKEAAKPAPAKVVTKESLKGSTAKYAVLKNAERSTGKTTKVSLAVKAEPVKVSAKPMTLTKSKTHGNNLRASALAFQQKGKFGKENRTIDENEARPRREVPRAEPLRPTNREIARADEAPEPAPRRIRPRVVEEPAKETPTTPRNAEQDRISDAPKMPIASPDRIEVHEPGSPVIVQMHQLPTSRPSAPYGTVVTRGNTPPTARKDINMAQQRIFEIQYELAKRGFYTAEPNGIYDDVTVAAMWEFQKNYGLPATGYPTAHSLKRLGLTSW